MKTVNIHEAKTNLSIAEIIPVERKKRTIPSDELKNIQFIAPPELPTTEEWSSV